MDTDTKQPNWIEQCEKIASILREAKKATENVVGAPIHDQSGPRQEPFTLAEKLSDALDEILQQAQVLADQVQRFQNHF